MTVYIGGVQTFKETRPDKAQALKPLEEAAEVFAAWQDIDSIEGFDRQDAFTSLVDECADAIQAVCNLLASMGVTDLREAMERCAERNRARGRL